MLNPAIENIIKLYRNNKISKYVVEKELFNLLDNKVRTNVVIEDSKVENNTFMVTSIPEKKGDFLSITYVLDGSMFNLPFTDEEIFKAFLTEISLTQKSLNMFSKFMTVNIDNEVGVREALSLFLRIMRQSLSSLPEGIKNKMSDLNRTVRANEIEDLYYELEQGNEPINSIIEGVLVKGWMPAYLVNAAKELAERHFNNLKREVIKDGVERPTINEIQNTMKEHGVTDAIPGPKSIESKRF